jgi:hypothetical protein
MYYREQNYVWPVFVAIVMAVLVVMLIMHECHKQEEWERYKQTHNCQVIRRIDGHSGVGVSSGGETVVVSTGSRIVYRCDDGMEYEKEE